MRFAEGLDGRLRIGTTVHARIRRPVTTEKLAGAPSRETLLEMLRERAYALGEAPAERRSRNPSNVLSAMRAARNALVSRSRQQPAEERM